MYNVCHRQVVDEFLLLGSQPLSALHDALGCVAGDNLAAAGRGGAGSAYLFAEVGPGVVLHVVPDLRGVKLYA